MGFFEQGTLPEKRNTALQLLAERKNSETTSCPVCFRAVLYKKDSISRSMKVLVSMLNEGS